MAQPYDPAQFLAGGSNAVLQLQQNVAQAPYVQQNVAADAQAKQLAVQALQQKVQQDTLNVEKTRLANIVTDSEIKINSESRTKLQELYKTPDFQAALKSNDDASIASMIGSTLMKSGKFEDGLRATQQAEAINAKKLANESKQLDMQHELVGNASSVIDTVPDAEVKSFVNRLPEANKKALISQIGEANYNRMSGTEIKEAAKNLMLNAKGQLAVQKMLNDIERQKLVDASRENVAHITGDWHKAVKGMGNVTGGTKEEIQALKVYQQSAQKNQVAYKKERQDLDKAVTDAAMEMNKSRMFGNLFGDKTDAKKVYDAAVERRRQFDISRLKDDISNASFLPDGTTKDRVLNELKKQGVALGVDSKEDKTAPAPTKKDISVKPNVAPTTKITPEDFNSKWGTLKSGQSLVGPDGVTYTKQ